MTGRNDLVSGSILTARENNRPGTTTKPEPAKEPGPFACCLLRKCKAGLPLGPPWRAHVHTADQVEDGGMGETGETGETGEAGEAGEAGGGTTGETGEMKD